jgi:propanol-preferring alcohol dehydrogenase
MLVTAVSPPAFSQALHMGSVAVVPAARRSPTPIFNVVLKRVRERGSIVVTRRDLDEAIASAAKGKVKAGIARAPFDNINAIFATLNAG